jgi:hypothetical protein
MTPLGGLQKELQLGLHAEPSQTGVPAVAPGLEPPKSRSLEQGATEMWLRRLRPRLRDCLPGLPTRPAAGIEATTKLQEHLTGGIGDDGGRGGAWWLQGSCTRSRRYDQQGELHTHPQLWPQGGLGEGHSHGRRASLVRGRSHGRGGEQRHCVGKTDGAKQQRGSLRAISHGRRLDGRDGHMPREEDKASNYFRGARSCVRLLEQGMPACHTPNTYGGKVMRCVSSLFCLFLHQNCRSDAQVGFGGKGHS